MWWRSGPVTMPSRPDGTARHGEVKSAVGSTGALPLIRTFQRLWPGINAGRSGGSSAIAGTVPGVRTRRALSSGVRLFNKAAPEAGDTAAARSASGTIALTERAGLGPDGAGLMSAAGLPPRFIHHRHASLQPTESHGAVLCSALTSPFITDPTRIKETRQRPTNGERTERTEGSASIAATVASGERFYHEC